LKGPTGMGHLTGAVQIEVVCVRTVINPYFTCRLLVPFVITLFMVPTALILLFWPLTGGSGEIVRAVIWKSSLAVPQLVH